MIHDPIKPPPKNHGSWQATMSEPSPGQLTNLVEEPPTLQSLLSRQHQWYLIVRACGLSDGSSEPSSSRGELLGQVLPLRLVS